MNGNKFYLCVFLFLSLYLSVYACMHVFFMNKHFIKPIQNKFYGFLSTNALKYLSSIAFFSFKNLFHQWAFIDLFKIFLKFQKISTKRDQFKV